MVLSSLIVPIVVLTLFSVGDLGKNHSHCSCEFKMQVEEEQAKCSFS